MSDMTHKMWSQWKDFRLNEKKGDHEGQMAKSQLKRSVKLARMNYEIIDGMKKDEDGEVELPAGTEMVMPGDDGKFTVKLITPIAMSENLNFAIREGGKTVGAGVVTKIVK